MNSVEIEKMLDSLVERKVKQEESCPFDGITNDISRDILVAYVRFVEFCKSTKSRRRHLSCEQHECSSECHPLFRYKRIFICPASGNLHICTKEMCRLKRVSEDDDHERCPLTFEEHAPLWVCSIYDVDGGTTGFNAEYDDTGCDYSHDVERGEFSDVLNVSTGHDGAFVLPLVEDDATEPSPVTSPTLPPLESPSAEPRDLVPTNRLKRKWGEPVPRLEFIAEKKEKKQKLELSRPRGRHYKATQRQQETKQKTTANVRIKNDKQGPVNDQRLMNKGQDIIRRIFARRSVELDTRFVAWAAQISVLLFSSIRRHPVRKHKLVNYVFQEHVIVVLLEMSHGLIIRGHHLIPECEFIKQHLSSSKTITLKGQIPRDRNETRKHLKIALCSIPSTELIELSRRIERLGVF